MINVCNTSIEDNENFLLHFPLYDQMHDDLFGHLSEIPGLEPINLSSKLLCDLLLSGNESFQNIENKLILETTIFICLLEGWSEDWSPCGRGGRGIACIASLMHIMMHIWHNMAPSKRYHIAGGVDTSAALLDFALRQCQSDAGVAGGHLMNLSIWRELPLAFLPSAGALPVVLRFVWLYGNWASFV